MIDSNVDLRCPLGPRKLLAKLRVADIQPTITSDNLLELCCPDCRRRLRSDGHSDIKFVLHRFNIVGELVETEIVRGHISASEYPSEG